MNAQISSLKIKLQIFAINVIMHVTIAQDPMNIIVLLVIKVNISFNLNVYLKSLMIFSKIKFKINVYNVIPHATIVQDPLNMIALLAKKVRF